MVEIKKLKPLFKNGCPYCGKRLMLCDECTHSSNDIPCDYNSVVDCCLRQERK